MKTASSQLAHAVNRMLRYKPHDPLAAEFIRTFRNQNFPGQFFLERFEALSKRQEQMDVQVMLPKQAIGKGILDVVSCYGSRSGDADFVYFSPCTNKYQK